MVRILKVSKELEERKRQLLARSEVYRQTLKLEVANIRYSTALLKRKFSFLRTSSRLLGLAVPLAGLLLFRRRAKPANTGNGFLAKLLSGFNLFKQLRPFFQAVQGGHRGPKRNNITQYP
jgi:hypothetical protein